MNARILQDRLSHQLRMVDAEMLETRARRLESYLFVGTSGNDTNASVRKEIKELYERAQRIRNSLEPKG